MRRFTETPVQPVHPVHETKEPTLQDALLDPNLYARHLAPYGAIVSVAASCVIDPRAPRTEPAA